MGIAHGNRIVREDHTGKVTLAEKQVKVWVGLARVTQPEDTVGVKTLGQETGMYEGLEATVNVVGKNSRDVSRENSTMKVGMGVQMA